MRLCAARAKAKLDLGETANIIRVSIGGTLGSVSSAAHDGVAGVSGMKSIPKQVLIPVGARCLHW